MVPGLIAGMRNAAVIGTAASWLAIVCSLSCMSVDTRATARCQAPCLAALLRVVRSTLVCASPDAPPDA